MTSSASNVPIASTVYAGGRLSWALAITFWGLVLWYHAPLAYRVDIAVLTAIEARSAVLGLAVMFLIAVREHLSPPALVIGGLGALSAWVMPSMDALPVPGLDPLVAGVGTIILIEAVRRAIGWPAALVLAAAIIALAVLGVWAGETDIVHALSRWVWLGTEGVFGVPLGLGLEFMLLPLLIGGIFDAVGLSHSGADRLFAPFARVVGQPSPSCMPGWFRRHFAGWVSLFATAALMAGALNAPLSFVVMVAMAAVVTLGPAFGLAWLLRGRPTNRALGLFIALATSVPLLAVWGSMVVLAGLGLMTLICMLLLAALALGDVVRAAAMGRPDGGDPLPAASLPAPIYGLTALTLAGCLLTAVVAMASWAVEGLAGAGPPPLSDWTLLGAATLGFLLFRGGCLLARRQAATAVGLMGGIGLALAVGVFLWLAVPGGIGSTYAIFQAVVAFLIYWGVAQVGGPAWRESLVATRDGMMRAMELAAPLGVTLAAIGMGIALAQLATQFAVG